MTRFTVPIKNILGNAYYRYKLESTVTNGTIGGTADVTVTVTNVFGAPVANKAVSLYHQGVLESTQNTGSNGKYTWTISLGNAESLRVLQVENQTIYIRVNYDTGWVSGSTFMNTNVQSYDVNHPHRIRRIGKVVHMEGIVKNNNALGGDETGAKISGSSSGLPTQFRPSNHQYSLQQGSGNNKFLLHVYPNGDIYLERYGTTSNTSVPSGSWLHMNMTWFVD